MFLSSFESKPLKNVSVHLTHVVVLPGGEASEDTAQEDFQYKLKGFIDSTVDKRYKVLLIKFNSLHTHVI